MFKPINTNKGQTINIPLMSTANYQVDNRNIWITGRFHYNRGERVATCISLSSYCNECDSKGYIGSGQFVYQMCQDMANNKHATEYYASGQGKTYIDLITSHISWIWGNMETGGVGLVKLDSGDYTFISFAGIATDENKSEYLYFFATPTTNNIQKLSRSELSEVVFYNPEYINNDYTLGLYYKPTSDKVARGTFLKYEDGLYLYTPEESTVRESINDSKYVDAIEPLSKYVPEVFWTIMDSDNNEVLAPWRGYISLGRNDLNTLGLTIRSGSIYGDIGIDSDNPYENAGNATKAGGDGEWANDCDSSPIPSDDQFTIDAINSGFITLYNPTEQDIRDFNNFLFTDISDSMSATLKKLISNPIDYVVFVAMTHFKPAIAPSIPIKFCGIDSGVTAPQITKQVQKLDCGYIELSELKMTKSFLSYEPYMKASVFLPYIGNVSLNCDDIMGESKLHLVYIIDMLTGSCVAELELVSRESRSYADSYVSNVVIGEYTGNIYQNLPITSTDWRGLFSSVIALGSGLATLATGNSAGLGSIASAVTTEKQHVTRSGNLGANYGYLGRQRPCLILERPVLHMPDDFEKWEGYPSGLTKKLGDLHGYTEIDSTTLWVNDMDGITEEEADMLRTICENGIIL